MHLRTPRRATAAGVVLAVVAPAALTTLAPAPASAAPLPATYTASAHGDVVDLDAHVLGGTLAGAVIGHSRSTVASAGTTGTSGAASANLDASLAFGGVPVQPDREAVTAPPSADPPARDLLDLPLDPVVDVGLVRGDVGAAWSGGDACVPLVGGERVLSDALTTLSGVRLAALPEPIGTLAEVTASRTRTRTALVDRGASSDVVARTTTTIGDIDLLGGRVSVDVTNPVVLEARSDGTTGTSGFVSPPTVTATIGGSTIGIPLDGRPRAIDLGALDALVDLSVTAFTPSDTSTGATGRGTLDALLRIDLEVLSLVPGGAATDVSLAVAPMSVEATAPTGGVECNAADATAPTAPDITAPAPGTVTSDSTPAFSGTAEPGSTVVVRDADGTEVCTDQAGSDGAWSCTPSGALPEGEHPWTATATDAAGNTSPPGTTTFTVDTTGPGVTVFTPADGAATTDLTPLVTGTSEPGASVTVREAGSTVCTATAADDGSWACTPTTPLLVGPHTWTATATDAAGNASAASTTFSVVVVSPGDGAAPDVPVITAPADGSSDQDPTPRVGGTGEPGATVTVREGDTVLCTAVVAADGTWACTSAVRLPAGAHVLTATQTDPSGNTSDADTVRYTVLAPAPDPGPTPGPTPAPGPGDTDGDGLPDSQEGGLGTDPHDADSDGDGLGDGAEVTTHHTDPLEADTDGDGLTDGREVTGTRIRERFAVCGRKARSSITVRTDPLRADSDRDGLTDGREVKGYRIKQRVVVRATGSKARVRTVVIGRTRSNPTRKDTDRDGLADRVEKTGSANRRFGRQKSDPTTCDTDRGGVSDGREVRAGSNPSDVRSGPRRPLARDGRSDRLPQRMG